MLTLYVLGNKRIANMSARDKYFPPLFFCAVEEGVYRSAVPTELNFSFLKTLQLKSVIMLGELPTETFSEYMRAEEIQCINIESSINPEWGEQATVSEELAVKALCIVAETANLPALVVCKNGKFLTGAVMGCLRKLTRWSLVSIFEEYRRLAGYSASKLQQQHEQFIELFDTDLIPITSTSPPFLRR